MKRKLTADGKSITTATFLKVMCAAMLYGLLSVVVILLSQVCFPFITLVFIIGYVTCASVIFPKVSALLYFIDTLHPFLITLHCG